MARANARYGFGVRSTRTRAPRTSAVAMIADARDVATCDGVLRVGEEGEVARAGLVDGGDARHLDVAVAFELAPELRGQIAELHTSRISRGRRGHLLEKRREMLESQTVGELVEASLPLRRRPASAPCRSSASSSQA